MPLATLSSYRNRTPGALPMQPPDPWNDDLSFHEDPSPSSPFDDGASQNWDTDAEFSRPPREPKTDTEGNTTPQPVTGKMPAAGWRTERAADGPPPPPPASTSAQPGDGRSPEGPPAPPVDPSAAPRPYSAQSDTEDESEDATSRVAPAGAGSSTLSRLQALQAPPAPKPKWYNRLAAAAAGAAGGYMGVRYPGRVNPQTVQQAEQNLLAPGYGRQRGAYEQQRADLEQQLHDEQTKESTDALTEQRLGQAEARRARAKRDSEENDNKAAIAAEQVAQRDLASKRTAFAKMIGKHTPVYVDKGTAVPPGFSAMEDPDVPGKVALVPAGMRQAPKELVEGGYLPGYQAGDQVDSELLGKAYDAYFKESRQQNKPDNKNATIPQMYLDAAGGDAKKALEKYRQDQVNQAQASRAPREPSVAEINRQKKETVNKLANRALKDSFSNGGASIDDVIANVQKFYMDDDDMNDNRGDVLALLNGWKRSGLTNEQISAKINRAAGWKAQMTGGRGAATPAPPPARNVPARPVTGPVFGGDAAAPPAPGAPPAMTGELKGAPPPPPAARTTGAGGGGRPRPQAPQAQQPPGDVIARLGPGIHTFANGQTWRFNPDGTAVLVNKK